MMEWHRRFVQQAVWTKNLRSYLFNRIRMHSDSRALEVGCGTGAVLSDMAAFPHLHGLDLQPRRLLEARRNCACASLTCGDALSLPYAPDSFDIVFCHFLLLWVRYPLQALCEMKRVARSSGSILALAEPDYTGRVDKPDELAELGRWQTESLRRQGADPGLGRRLAELFHQAGIPLIETGQLQPEGQLPLTPEELDMEWAVLEADLAGLLPPPEIQRLKRLDERAWQRGERVLHVPTYFAWGQLT